jgi:hypothetical protein
MKHIYLLSSILLASLIVSGQVGIGTNSPDQSAQLQVFSNNQGVLFPQVDLAAASFPTGPAEGLMVWNTNAGYGNGIGYYINKGSKLTPDWVRLGTESNASLEDIGIIVAFPGATYPNDIYLPLSGGTFNNADYPEFAAFVANLDADVVTDNGNGTFTLANWNSNGEFLRGQGGNAGPLGSLQSDATALPNSNFITDTIGNHNHLIDPPSTSTSTTGSHNHFVDPPSTSTSSDGGHNHSFYTANNDMNSYQSQGYPAWDNHVAFRTTDRRDRTENNNTIQSVGGHTHSVDIGSFNSSTSGSHSHTVDITTFFSGSAGAHNHSITSGGDAETRPVNRSVLWVIKVKPSSSVADTLIITNVTNVTNNITNPTVNDADWYIPLTTNSPTTITQDVYTGGNVGIGDFDPGDPNGPQDRLHIKSPTNVHGFVESTSTGSAGMRYKNANREYFAGINISSDKFVIYDNTAALERISVESDGKLRANYGIQVGGGSSMNKIQAGTLTAGPGASATLVVTLTFPSAFSSIPIVVATPRTETGQTYTDNFSITTKSVTTTSVIFNIERTDSGVSWTQNLLVDWIAIGL